jgi:RimJ/RimL family protein N-acetyltransferase
MSETVFESPRLRCRRWTRDDLDALTKVYGDRDAMRWVGDGEPLTREDCERWLGVTARNYAQRGYGMFALEDRASGRVVGFVGLVHPGGQAQAEVKYALAREHWGRGLATEAVRALLDRARVRFGVAEVVATVAPDNRASQRVLAKAGMRLREVRANDDGSRTLLYAWMAPRADPLPVDAGLGILRRFAPADLAAFQAYRGDPWVGRYQGWSPMSDTEAAAFIAGMRDAELFRAGEWSQIAIAAPDGGALLGDIGLHLSADRSEAEIGFSLAPAAQGRGIGTAAVRAAIDLVFRATPARRVVGITDDRNLPSMRLLERAGMRLVGKAATVFRGEPCVEATCAIARPGEPGGDPGADPA